MDAFDLASEIYLHPNLSTAGDLLVQFSDAAMNEKNRKKPVDYLLRGLSVHHSGSLFQFPKSADSRKPYDLVSGSSAAGVWLAFELLAIRTTPVKTLKAIKEFGSWLSEVYCEPIGDAISEEEIERVIDYLEKMFGLRSAVLSDGHDVILLIPSSHRERNSECLPIHSSETYPARVILSLYHMGAKAVAEGVDPRFVFCHELGHALHSKYADKKLGNVELVPMELLDFLEPCFPMIKKLDQADQKEILADVLAMGMLHRSPFADADCFSTVLDIDKKVLSDLVRIMCEIILDSGSCKVRNYKLKHSVTGL